MESDTYYEILGVSSTAPPAEIKAKYRKLIQRIHPDLDGPPALFRQVQEAYEVLSDPARRAAYDRSLATVDGIVRTAPTGPKTGSARDTGSRQAVRNTGEAPGRSGTTGPPRGARQRGSSRNPSRTNMAESFLRRHPARVVAIAGAALLAIGAALGPDGRVLFVLGPLALILAGVAGLGGRGANEHEEFQRSGMAAIDAMTGRQLEVLLEHFFANKGYRVARLRARGHIGADLLLDDPDGRTIVQVRRWSGVVRRDAVHQAVGAKAHYGVARALVVTSSDYSQEAVMAASSHGVTLWNRADLAAELAAFRGEALQSGVHRFSSDVRAGCRICLGFFATLLVAFVVTSARARSLRPSKRPR